MSALYDVDILDALRRRSRPIEGLTLLYEMWLLLSHLTMFCPLPLREEGFCILFFNFLAENPSNMTFLTCIQNKKLHQRRRGRLIF